MSQTAQARRHFGDGPLSRAAALIHTLLTVGLLLALTTAPTLVAAVFLGADARNLPLLAVAALPVGPAVAAALFALHRHSSDLADLHPAADFRRGYRANAVDALKVWVPLLAWLTILAINLTHLDAAGVPGWWAVPLTLIMVASCLWAVNALVIVSLFAFRGRDVARLAAYLLIRKPQVTLGVGSLMIVTTAVVVLSSEGVLLLVAPVVLLLLLRTARPLIAVVEREFVG